jgi:hypothetical protein
MATMNGVVTTPAVAPEVKLQDTAISAEPEQVVSVPSDASGVFDVLIEGRFAIVPSDVGYGIVTVNPDATNATQETCRNREIGSPSIAACATTSRNGDVQATRRGHGPTTKCRCALQGGSPHHSEAGKRDDGAEFGSGNTWVASEWWRVSR